MRNLPYLAFVSILATTLSSSQTFAQMPTPRTISQEKALSSNWSVDKVYFLAYQGGLFERSGRKMTSPSSEGVVIFNVPQFTDYMKKNKMPIVNRKFDGAIERLNNTITYSEKGNDYAYELEIISYQNPALANKALAQGSYSKNMLLFNFSQFNLIFRPIFSDPENYTFLYNDLRKIFPTIKQIKK